MAAGPVRALKFIAGLILGLCLVQGARAAAPARAPVTPTTGRYRVDTTHTEILFGIRALGFTTYYGTFSGATGALTLDRETPETSRLEIHVPTASLAAPNRAMATMLKGPKWLNVAAYPEMVFKADRITLTSPTTATVAGALTLHGITRPLSLQAHFDQRGEAAPDHQPRFGFQARGHLKRSDYGLIGPSPLASDEVQLILSAAFEHVTAGPQGAITP